MARIRGGHTDPSVSCEARSSASAPQDSSQAPQSPTVLSSEGGVPSSPPQRRYSSRRPPTSLLPEPSVHHIPPKRARTSGPGETSRHSQLKPQAQRILRILPALLQKPSSRGLWFSHRPLRAIQIVEPSHFILSFISTLKLCDSSRTFRIHLDCSRGTISSALWLTTSFSTLEWQWNSISPWLLRAPRVPSPFISALIGARVS